MSINLADLTSYQGYYIKNSPFGGDYLGTSVSGIGDINRDGYDDVITTDLQGKAYVIYGNSSFPHSIFVPPSSSEGITITPFSGESACIAAVSGAGDINGDGYDDIIIGVYIADMSYVIYGGASLPSSIDVSSLGDQGFSITGSENSWSGYSVSGAGDINGDGLDDFIVGSPGTYSANAPGISYVIFGGQSLPDNIALSDIDLYGFSVTGSSNDVYSGAFVSGLGDINADGFSDIIIGAYGSNNYAGISYVLYGKADDFNDVYLSDLVPSLGYYILGASSGDCYFGCPVSGAGDINNDGYYDIIIGAPNASPDSFLDNAGVTYLIYGNATNMNLNLTILSSYQGFYIFGSSSYENSGNSVSRGGDINNDGYDDFIVGAPGANSSSGATYVIYGQSALTSIHLPPSISQGFSILGASPGDASAVSVSGAGDVNNDGFYDVIIGASNVDSTIGESYVVYGSILSSEPTTTPSFIPTIPPSDFPSSESNNSTLSIGAISGIVVGVGVLVFGFLAFILYRYCCLSRVSVVETNKNEAFGVSVNPVNDTHRDNDL
eukprot:gene20317-26372_t